jgi:hypothetical protein
LSHALITAHTDRGRRLFAIRLDDPRVRVAEGGWVARGLTEVISGPIELLDCAAIPIGPDEWYVIVRVGHCLGPAPLAQDERHARRVADLQLYVRQHHAERDEATLGRQVLTLADWR